MWWFFRHPESDVHYIKRIIGRPGDTVDVYVQDVDINNHRLRREQQQEVYYYRSEKTDWDKDGRLESIMYSEEMPQGGWHSILQDAGIPHMVATYSPDKENCKILQGGLLLRCHIPPHHYFVLGDNRDHRQRAADIGGWCRVKIWLGQRGMLFLTSKNCYMILRTPTAAACLYICAKRRIWTAAMRRRQMMFLFHRRMIMARRHDFLSYVFSDENLERQALTHRSTGAPHNERLEWLGDALLDLLVGQMLFERYPEWDEGTLTYARAQLVNGETLAALAQKIGLSQRLRLRSAKEKHNSMLAGALEAYFAAVYLDGGFAAATAVAQKLFAEAVQQMDGVRMDTLKDAKTRLQEHQQKRGAVLPIYEMLARGGVAHQPYFVVQCLLADGQSALAVADNRRDAEKMACRCLLARLAA